MFGIETIFDTFPQFLVVCLILATAEAVYVLLGFGAGLIAVGTMALLLPELKDAVVLLLLINLPAELWVVRSSWKRISWRGVLVIFVGVSLMVVLGERFGSSPDPQRLQQDWLRPKTEIPGLYLAGQDVLSCGVVGAMIGGFLAAVKAGGPRAWLLARKMLG